MQSKFLKRFQLEAHVKSRYRNYLYTDYLRDFSLLFSRNWLFTLNIMTFIKDIDLMIILIYFTITFFCLYSRILFLVFQSINENFFQNFRCLHFSSIQNLFERGITDYLSDANPIKEEYIIYFCFWHFYWVSNNALSTCAKNLDIQLL